MANNPGSIYPQFMQMKKNQFKHTVNKQMMKFAGKPKTKKQVQGDTPDPDAMDEQSAQARTLKKIGGSAYKGDIDALAAAYGSFDSGDSGTFGAGGGKGGGGFGGK